MKQAAIIVGIDRNTIARWVAAGRLKGKKAMMRNLSATLVSVAAVRKLKNGETRGRPRKVAK